MWLERQRGECSNPHPHEPYECGRRVSESGGICGECLGKRPGRRPAAVSEAAQSSHTVLGDAAAELDVTELSEDDRCGVDALLGSEDELGEPREVIEMELQAARVKKPRKARSLLDFTQQKFLVLGLRLQGSVRAWAAQEAEDLDVQETKLDLFFAWMYFLGETLLQQTGAWEVAPAIKQWWRDGSQPMSDQEMVYMRTCQPAMDSSQRSRGPKLCELYSEMRQWCRIETSDQHLRLLVVWIHFVQIGYFMGRLEFLHEVLLNPPNFERSQVKTAVVAYIQGSSESYLPELVDRLQFYALTRTSLSCYFNSSDGQRTPWYNSAECLRYASCSRCFDSLIHVHKLDSDWNSDHMKR